jgi:hypothetical protein
VPVPLIEYSPGTVGATGTDTIGDDSVVPLNADVTWMVALPLTLKGTWNETALADSYATGAAWPLTSTCTLLQFVGNGRAFAQLKKLALPKFEPVITVSIPGAMVPPVIDAAFNTPALVKAGDCACAARTHPNSRTVRLVRVFRKLCSIRKCLW